MLQKTLFLAIVSGLERNLNVSDAEVCSCSESAQVPGGIRIGTSALTSRDMQEEDMKVVASFLHRAVQITLQLQKDSGSKLVKDLLKVANDGKSEGAKAIAELRKEVRAFARKWPLPGVDVKGLKKPDGFENDD